VPNFLAEGPFSCLLPQFPLLYKPTKAVISVGHKQLQFFLRSFEHLRPQRRSKHAISQGGREECLAHIPDRQSFFFSSLEMGFLARKGVPFPRRAAMSFVRRPFSASPCQKANWGEPFALEMQKRPPLSTFEGSPSSFAFPLLSSWRRGKVSEERRGPFVQSPIISPRPDPFVIPFRENSVALKP